MISSVLSQALRGLAIFLCGASVAYAGSFSVSPVRATLSARQSAGSLTVRNDGEGPSVIQIEIVAWSQKDGREVFVPTSEILATPPIFTVPAGGSQVVRVGLRRAPDTKRELTYRMFLQEVPPPPRPGFQGLQVALRISVPVFVLPMAEARRALAWSSVPVDQGQFKLRVTNTGNAHAQIANFTLSRPQGEQLTTQQVAAYVLPGESREWPVKSTIQPGAVLHLTAKTDGDDVQTEVTVAAP